MTSTLENPRVKIRTPHVRGEFKDGVNSGNQSKRGESGMFCHFGQNSSVKPFMLVPLPIEDITSIEKSKVGNEEKNKRLMTKERTVK